MPIRKVEAAKLPPRSCGCSIIPRSGREWAKSGEEESSRNSLGSFRFLICWRHMTAPFAAVMVKFDEMQMDVFCSAGGILPGGPCPVMGAASELGAGH